MLIAFDDPTAPSFGPVRRLAIEAILEELQEAGVPEENVRLLCANALHRRWTREELARILARCLKLAAPGAIYVFHVGRASQDAIVLPQVIHGLRDAGYGFRRADQA